jgi:hypothetical protein
MEITMKSKLTVLFALVLMTFAASSATVTRKATIKTFFQEQPNGDYRLFIFGSDRSLVCEEKPITVVQQGDAVSPVVIECKH